MDAVKGFLAEEQDWATVRAQSQHVTRPTVSDAAEAWTTCVTSDVANSTIWTLCGISALQECRYTHITLD